MLLWLTGQSVQGNIRSRAPHRPAPSTASRAGAQGNLDTMGHGTRERTWTEIERRIVLRRDGRRARAWTRTSSPASSRSIRRSCARRSAAWSATASSAPRTAAPSPSPPLSEIEVREGYPVVILLEGLAVRTTPEFPPEAVARLRELNAAMAERAHRRDGGCHARLRVPRGARAPLQQRAAALDAAATQAAAAALRVQLHVGRRTSSAARSTSTRRSSRRWSAAIARRRRRSSRTTSATRCRASSSSSDTANRLRVGARLRRPHTGK